jgi:phospholipid-binding lipoprotein MlaA
VRRSPEGRVSVTVLLAALVLLATGCGTLSEVVAPPVASTPSPLAAVASAPEATPTIPLDAAFGAAEVPTPPPTLTSALVPGSPVVSGESSSSKPALVTPGTEVGGESAGTTITAEAAGTKDTDESPTGMAQVRETPVTEEPEDYDPWEPYNERMFAFNYNVDRYVLKPVANVYRHIVPEPFQIMITNGFDNVRFPARFVNHVLQGRFWGAFTETSRFVINTVLGVGGLFNPATDYFGVPRSSADFGQTMHKWGIGAGPFFVPPFLPPATVRDFIGRLADSALNPIAWFLLDFWPEGLAIGIGEMVNQRAVTYELFQGVEETTLDLYTAVRDGYLRRRERQLQRPEE